MWKMLRRTEHSGTTAKMLAEKSFTRMLCLERKRSHRSQRRFALMLLEPCGLDRGGTSEDALTKVLRALPASTRDTDITGWYKERSVIGVIFTEIGTAETRTIENALLGKVVEVLNSALSTDEVTELRLSFQVLPAAVDRHETDEAIVYTLYRDVMWNNRCEESLSLHETGDLKAATEVL